MQLVRYSFTLFRSSHLCISDQYDLMSMSAMQNPPDHYSYYAPSLYPTFGPFDDHSQWGAADTSGTVLPGTMPFHPQMYTPSPLDLSRSQFEYPPQPHAYSHYHSGFAQSNFAGPPSTGTSGFDIPWNLHNLAMQPMQIAPQQQMTPIGGGLTLNKKPSVYDEYPSASVGDMLAQHMNSVDLGGGPTNEESHAYDNGANDPGHMLSSREQQQHQHHQHHYQSSNNNLSLSSRQSQAPPPSSNGPKSYASVVSADTLSANSNKSTPSVSNVPVRSSIQSASNEHHNDSTPHFSNDPANSRSNTNMRGNNNNQNNMNNYNQQPRNGSGGYNPRNQQQQQPSSTSGGFLNWTNNNTSSNSRGNNHNSGGSSTYYNSGSSNYYDRPSYSSQQTFSSSNNASSPSNKRPNSNYQQNYSASRTTNNMSNGGGSSAATGSQPITPANQEILDTLKRNHQYNPKDFVLNPKGARFFVIKSVSSPPIISRAIERIDADQSSRVQLWDRLMLRRVSLEMTETYHRAASAQQGYFSKEWTLFSEFLFCV